MTHLKRTLLLMIVSPVMMLALGCRSKSGVQDDPGFIRTPNYKYAELIVKDYDEMRAMVLSQVRKAQAAGEDGASVEHLQGALKLIFTRPDSDNMVAKLVPEVRRELIGMGAYDRAIAQLAAEAMDNLKNTENQTSVRTSASFILENILAEIRPDAERENGEMRKVVQRIVEARAQLPDQVKNERKLRGMYSSKNPSDEAGRIIKVIETREKAERQALEKVERERAREAKRQKK